MRFDSIDSGVFADSRLRQAVNEAVKCRLCDAVRDSDPKIWVASVRLVLDDGARAGSRTLNLGIKRLPTDRLRTSQGGSGRLTCIRTFDATVSGRLRKCQAVSGLSCQTVVRGALVLGCDGRSHNRGSHRALLC